MIATWIALACLGLAFMAFIGLVIDSAINKIRLKGEKS